MGLLLRQYGQVCLRETRTKPAGGAGPLASPDFLPNRLANQPNNGLPKIKAKAKVDNTPPAEVLL